MPFFQGYALQKDISWFVEEGPSGHVKLMCLHLLLPLWNDGWNGKLPDGFKKLNALHLELEEKAHDPATIQSYEAYKKRLEEQRE